MTKRPLCSSVGSAGALHAQQVQRRGVPAGRGAPSAPRGGRPRRPLGADGRGGRRAALRRRRRAQLERRARAGHGPAVLVAAGATCRTRLVTSLALRLLDLSGDEWPRFLLLVILSTYMYVYGSLSNVMSFRRLTERTECKNETELNVTSSAGGGRGRGPGPAEHPPHPCQCLVVMLRVRLY